MECQREQPFEVVRANAAPFAVAHRRNGNGRDAHGAINLNHTAIENDRDENGHDLEAQADQQRLYGQAEQFANAHRFHAGAHLFKSAPMPIVSMLARICSRVDSMSMFVSPLMTPAAPATTF